MSQERPLGITAIAGLCLALAVTSLFFAGMIAAGQLPLSSGAFLLGGGLEQSGPLAFVLYAGLLLATALGVAKRWNLARRAAILVAVAGIAVAAPAISSAVDDSRLYAIAREGAQIIIRVLIIFYLTQGPVKSWFQCK